jgi:hypothetical protein
MKSTPTSCHTGIKLWATVSCCNPSEMVVVGTSLEHVLKKGSGRTEDYWTPTTAFGLHTEGYVEGLGTGLLKRKLLHCHGRQASGAFLSQAFRC